MTASYAELTTPPTEAEQLAELLQLLTLAGFPATSWQSGSVPRTLVQIEATTLADLRSLVAEIGAGGLLAEAEGDWLDLLAASLFDETRVAAVKTQGQATLSCSALAGPYTVAVGQLVATNAAGKEFRNVTGGTLAAGGTLDLVFEGEATGSEYNLGNNELLILLTPLAGVAIANPAVPPSSTWITQTGADVESDEQLRERCSAKWATLGTGATSDSYTYWAREASTAVRRVNVLEHSNLGTPTDGHVTLYLAGELGTVDADAVAAVVAYIATRRPLCTTIHVAAASAVEVTITATVYVTSADQAQAEADTEDYLDELEAAIDVGGIAYQTAIIEQLMRPTGVRNTVVTEPAADVDLADNEVATFTLALTFTPF